MIRHSQPLVITEILQNPRQSSDFVGEFFEVFNPTAAAIDMIGWTIKDDDRDRFVVDGSVVVAPGGYAVFGVSHREWQYRATRLRLRRGDAPPQRSR